MNENKLQILKYPFEAIEQDINIIKNLKNKKDKDDKIRMINDRITERYYKSKWFDIILNNNEPEIETVFHASKFVEEQLIRPLIQSKLFIFVGKERIKKNNPNTKGFELLNYKLKRNINIWLE